MKPAPKGSALAEQQRPGGVLLGSGEGAWELTGGGRQATEQRGASQQRKQPLAGAQRPESGGLPVARSLCSEHGDMGNRRDTRLRRQQAAAGAGPVRRAGTR